MEQRLESSRLGRLVLSAVIVVILGAVLTWNLPPSQLATDTQPAFQRVMYGTGLDQNWSVFAPDPPQTEATFQALIVYADGTQRTWQVPTGGSLLGAYSDYRWLKWGEIVTAGIDARLWLPAAQWIARQEQGAGRRPVTVTLQRHLAPHTLAGPPGPPSTVDFYVYPVPGPAPGPAG
ncbi:MAG: hypothetical protein M3066_14530 [Actinomycetota bacterium]|nr:hypothetical protein [Actinomycetota bacterium]